MEKTIKQIIVCTIFETLSRLIVYSVLVLVFVNVILEMRLFRVYLKPLFKGKHELSIGVMILITVFLAYTFYKKIDRLILKDIDIILQNITTNHYSESTKISEFKRIQKELMQKNQEIKDKNCFLSTAISFISHDMKTPITVIHANIDLLRKNNNVITDKGMDRILRIENESAKISEYISSLMDVTTSLTKESNKEKISVKDCVRKIHNSILIYSDSIEEEIEVDCNMSCIENSYIVCDFKKLDKCMVHLLNNAFEHRKNRVKIEMRNDIKNIVFKVIDDGVGFNSDSLKKAKEMFYTDNLGRTSGKGYGIGLYFVNAYMETINGELVLCNGKDSGAEQIIKIPYYGGESDE